MNNFHQIPTDKFIPVSHDNSYLFNHYDKVANFLAFNLEHNYKSILAKPIQNGYSIDWFSNYTGLKSIKEFDKSSSEKALSEYWNIVGIVNAKIYQLENSNDENNRNWAGLLKKVFSHQDNFIFYNGINISIIWGWKFENLENYKPKFLINSQESDSDPESFSDNSAAPIHEIEEEESFEKPEEEIAEQEESYLTEEEEIIEEVIPEDEMYEDRGRFLDFLKWFASKFWWSLGLLALLIIIIFFIRTINSQNNFKKIDASSNQLKNNINASAF
jgi:hypothetical protein